MGLKTLELIQITRNFKFLLKISLKLFNMLNDIGKAIRGNQKPFGGIQLIFSGDFYQLPPVGNKDEPDTMKFCFESELWLDTFPLEDHVQLTEIFRQNDPVYTSILNQIREGRRPAHRALGLRPGRQCC